MVLAMTNRSYKEDDIAGALRTAFPKGLRSVRSTAANLAEWDDREFAAFMADDDHIACLHALVQDALAGVFLAIAYNGRAGEFEDRVVDASGFHHAALFREIAEQDSEAAILRVLDQLSSRRRRRTTPFSRYRPATDRPPI